MKRINETKDVTVTARKAEKIQGGKRKARFRTRNHASGGLKITQERDIMNNDVMQKRIIRAEKGTYSVERTPSFRKTANKY